MSGTRAGGLKAKEKNLAKDPDFYSKIGKKSQAAWEENGRRPRGFAFNRDLARLAGAKGGRASRRGKAKTK